MISFIFSQSKTTREAGRPRTASASCTCSSVLKTTNYSRMPPDPSPCHNFYHQENPFGIWSLKVFLICRLLAMLTEVTVSCWQEILEASADRYASNTTFVRYGSNTTFDRYGFKTIWLFALPKTPFTSAVENSQGSWGSRLGSIIERKFSMNSLDYCLWIGGDVRLEVDHRVPRQVPSHQKWGLGNQTTQWTLAIQKGSSGYLQGVPFKDWISMLEKVRFKYLHWQSLHNIGIQFITSSG